MKKILFTKKIDEQLVSNILGGSFYCEYIEAIRIKNRKVKPFNVRGKSIIFTSVNGVKSFFENGFILNQDFTNRLCFNRVYAVGIKTKRELRKYGVNTYKVFSYAYALIDFIINKANEECYIHFCGNLALDLFNNKLPLQNISYRRIVVYDIELLYPEINENYDGIVFFSPSGVRSVLTNNDIGQAKVFAIGRTTEDELKKYNIKNIITNNEANLDGIFYSIKNIEF